MRNSEDRAGTQQVVEDYGENDGDEPREQCGYRSMAIKHLGSYGVK
jgi:hypothetical protein